MGSPTDSGGQSAETLQDIPILGFPDAAAWEAWLAANYGFESGIWLKLAKKDSGVMTVSYADAVEVALCWGWIDGMGRSVDAAFYLQKFTPRRKRSLWSKVNIGKAEALIAAGRMRPPGLAAIEAAKADGRWEAAYDSAKEAVVPPDLAAVLDSDPGTKAYFESLNSANRYAVLWRLMTARTSATRASRLEKLTAMLKERKTFH